MLDENGRSVVDEYGNVFQIESTELARGGQGVVFRTAEGDLVVKQPTDKMGEIIRDQSSAEKFRLLISRIRTLPLPEGIHVAVPRSVLKGEAGYVMKLLSEMVPYSHFNESASPDQIEAWRAAHPDMKLPEDELTCSKFVNFLATGAMKARYLALSKCAAELGRLHSAGIVYGDVSPGNVFMKPDASEVWMIDPDNLRFETPKGAKAVYTPRYGAPELVQELFGGTPSSDVWAFAVMAFESLYMQHPFVGEAACSEDDAWDAEDSDTEAEDGEEKAYSGRLPFIDDPDDDSNCSVEGFSREIFSTPTLRALFQRTFGPGRTDPFVRVAAPIWAREFARLYDTSIVCPVCGMSYDAERGECPLCDSSAPPHATLCHRNRRLILTKTNDGDTQVYDIPERFFSPFSLTTNDRPTYHVKINFKKKTVEEVRMTQRMPFKPVVSFFNLKE